MLNAMTWDASNRPLVPFWRTTARLCCIFVALTAWNAGGCSYFADSARSYRQQHDIPDGAVLLIGQPLSVAPGRRDVHIQYGRVQPPGAVDRYYPYCEIVLRHLSDQARTVAAGRYEIHGAAAYVDRHGVSHGNVLYAGLGVGGDPAPSPQLYATRMELRGPAGSDVNEMTCGAWFDPAEARYPTIDEIRSVLGKLARLELQPRRN